MTARQIAYQAYLQSGHWKGLRIAALNRDKYHCQFCGRIERLQVHHRKYRDRWEDTRLEDLLTLCERCHKKHHKYHFENPKAKDIWRWKPNRQAKKLAQAFKEIRSSRLARYG